MSLNSVPSSERIHIGFFGNRNAGKSSIVNAVTGQELSIVSDILGTTTDPVSKAMELLPLGPVVVIDTPGIDDAGELGELRVGKALQVLNKTNIAVLVVDAGKGKNKNDEQLLDLFRKYRVDFITVYNKSDLLPRKEQLGEHEIYVSAKTGYHITELKEKMAGLVPKGAAPQKLVSDLIFPADLVVLVVPIDSGAPKGRLILPQQQTIRDILTANAAALVVEENELNNILQSIAVKPRLVITDSQVFKKVSENLAPDICLTSFSILFARYKGNLAGLVQGVKKLDSLKDGDGILIAEGCTHHKQCEDIGTVKLPGWIKAYTKKDLSFSFTSGTEFPDALYQYALIVHCGGCMLNEQEMKNRMNHASAQAVPMTNYGIAIAYMNGILKRCLEIFPEEKKLLE